MRSMRWGAVGDERVPRIAPNRPKGEQSQLQDRRRFNIVHLRRCCCGSRQPAVSPETHRLGCYVTPEKEPSILSTCQWVW